MATSSVCFRGIARPRRSVASVQTTTFGSASLSRSRTADALNPAKMTL
jgi:hypothetical protein